MKLRVTDFESFWNKQGRYLRINNAERFRSNLVEKLPDFDTVSQLDDYVYSLKKGRENARKVIIAFYRYLEDEYQVVVESDLFEKRFYDYPFERQLEIAKFLHTEKTPAEIQAHFDIDDRTMRKDLQELEEGITVLGSTIQITKEKHGRKYYYRTTLHPVFLPLNLTEVYALTVYLNRAIEDRNPNAKIIQNISDRVKSQLSDYALNRLFPDAPCSRSENQYIDDEALAKQREGILMYLMKSGEYCRLIWKNSEYKGRIVWHSGKYRIKLEDDTILDADIADVDFIIESLDYK